MSSLLHCLFRHCFEQQRDPREDDDEEEEFTERSVADNETIGTQRTPPLSVRRQSIHRGDSVYYVRAPGGQQTVLNSDYGTTMDQHESPLRRSIELASGDNISQNMPLWGGLVRLVRHASSRQGPVVHAEPNKTKEEDSNKPAPLYVKEAESFVLAGERDQHNSYPSIKLNEIVLPGSEVQRAMAKQMQLEMEFGGAHVEDECVICMDGFSPDNPRMPTLCGCGENKTYFHLPCLYQWIDQSRKCPSCRKKLVWEEF